MTDTSVAVRNPYWDAVRAMPEDDITRRFDGRFSPTSYSYRSTDGRFDPHLPTRHDFVARYAWSIPDPESVAFVAEHSQGRILDPLAGTGYWCWLLAQHGVDCAAADENPPGVTYNHWHSPRDENDKSLGLGENYFPVAQQDAVASVRDAADRTLLISWPPYGSTIGEAMLAAYEGDRVIYMGETSGGCCADDGLFVELLLGWELIADHRPVQWSGMHDWIEVYERRSVRRKKEDVGEDESGRWLLHRDDD